MLQCFADSSWTSSQKIRGAELPYLELVDLDARLPHQKKPTWRNNDKHESLEDLMNDFGLNFPAEASKAVRGAKIQSVKQLSAFSPHWCGTSLYCRCGSADLCVERWKFFCCHMIQGLSDQQEQGMTLPTLLCSSFELCWQICHPLLNSGLSLSEGSLKSLDT